MRRAERCTRADQHHLARLTLADHHRPDLGRRRWPRHDLDLDRVLGDAPDLVFDLDPSHKNPRRIGDKREVIAPPEGLIDVIRYQLPHHLVAGDHAIAIDVFGRPILRVVEVAVEVAIEPVGERHHVPAKGAQRRLRVEVVGLIMAERHDPITRHRRRRRRCVRHRQRFEERREQNQHTHRMPDRARPDPVVALQRRDAPGDILQRDEMGGILGIPVDAAAEHRDGRHKGAQALGDLKLRGAIADVDAIGDVGHEEVGAEPIDRALHPVDARIGVVQQRHRHQRRA